MKSFFIQAALLAIIGFGQIRAFSCEEFGLTVRSYYKSVDTTVSNLTLETSML